MASYNIFVFGKTDIGYDRFPFGSELKKQQDFINATVHPYLTNGINVKLLKCGFSHTSILTNENEIVEFGTMRNVRTVATVDRWKWNNDKVIDLKAGDGCNIAVTSNGSVYGWGNNDYGKLAFGKTEKAISTPTIIKAVNDIISIDLKYQTSYFLQSNFILNL
jgi:alpha-tubulin suppressor-like RCC1 family protein